MTASARWKATIGYRHDSGVVPVEHDIEELSELHSLVELGPHWATITEITITLERNYDPILTVEHAREI